MKVILRSLFQAAKEMSKITMMNSYISPANSLFLVKIKGFSSISPILNKKDKNIKDMKIPKLHLDTNNNENSDEDSESDFLEERDSKIIKTKVTSLRADVILKAGLNTARNKIETLFYESRIRINGQKVPKKSFQVKEYDEIDVVRSLKPSNHNYLFVSRVIILSVTEQSEDFKILLRCYKNLLIENYSGANVYRTSNGVDC